MSNYHLTIKSANAKTGPIPVTTSTRDNCPPDCGQAHICYADTGPLALHWSAVTAGTRGTSWADHVAQLAQLPRGSSGARTRPAICHARQAARRLTR